MYVFPYMFNLLEYTVCKIKILATEVLIVAFFFFVIKTIELDQRYFILQNFLKRFTSGLFATYTHPC